MGKESFTIVFDGFWREGNERDVPAQSGVFCVFEGRMILATGELKPQKLIFIGEAENARKQIILHANSDLWKKHVGRDNYLCFSFAPVAADKRKRVMAALVNRHKPPANMTYKETFPFDRTNVLIDGKVAMLGALVTAHRKS